MNCVFNNVSNVQQKIIIATINNIIKEAVKCGGDVGGPYNTQSRLLRMKLNALLEVMGIDWDYTITEDEEGYLYIIKTEERTKQIESVTKDKN